MTRARRCSSGSRIVITVLEFLLRLSHFAFCGERGEPILNFVDRCFEEAEQCLSWGFVGD